MAMVLSTWAHSSQWEETKVHWLDHEVAASSALAYSHISREEWLHIS